MRIVDGVNDVDSNTRRVVPADINVNARARTIVQHVGTKSLARLDDSASAVVSMVLPGVLPHIDGRRGIREVGATGVTTSDPHRMPIGRAGHARNRHAYKPMLVRCHHGRGSRGLSVLVKGEHCRKCMQSGCDGSGSVVHDTRVRR